MCPEAGSAQAGGEAGELHRKSLASQIADYLRMQILAGSLVPGAALLQEDLSRTFGTSRMPVRAALRRLGDEGLVATVGRERAIVVDRAVAGASDNGSVAVPVSGAMPRALLQRRSIGSQIADRVRNDILLGRLRPGTAIVQHELCERHGVSRVPVRDALRQLTYEGLLVASPNGRAVVARLTPDDIEDLFSTVAFIHGRAVRRTTMYATDSELVELGRLLREMKACVRQGELSRMNELNWEFHRRINLLARSPRLLAAIRATASGLPREYLLEFPGSIEALIREKRHVFAAMTDRDHDQAEARMGQHIERSGSKLIEYFQKNGLL